VLERDFADVHAAARLHEHGEEHRGEVPAGDDDLGPGADDPRKGRARPLDVGVD
jgi:hypothetical protein